MMDPMTLPDTITWAQLTTLVETACRAPSLHNSQPWRWRFDGQTLNLYADHTRVGRHTDRTGREVLLSCGAVLDHLVVAAAAAGWGTTIDRYPDPNDDDHVASVVFRRAGSVDERQRLLSAAISRRRSDRLAFESPQPWADMEHRLRAIVSGSGTYLDVIDDDGRPALADASRRSEHDRRDDSSYRYELLWWTGNSTDEGIPSSALPSAVEASHVDIAREFPAYGSDDRRPGVVRDHSNILVLSTYDDSRGNVLRCGEALSRVLLECTSAGFATCTLTHMIEIHSSREIVRRLTGRRTEPQVLVRVGRAGEIIPAPMRTLRRPVADVLQHS